MTHTTHKRNPTRSSKIRGDPMLRLAVRLHTLLSTKPSRCDPEAVMLQAIRQVLDETAALQQIWKHASAAKGKAWDTAVAMLLQRVPAAVERVRDTTSSLLRLPAPACDVTMPVSLGDLLAELHALRAEFGELQIEARLTCVSVETDPITLDGYYLGPFRIELHLSELREGRLDGSAFRCIATDPHPACSSECTTHPHVRDEMPCLGDAVVSIRSALRAGRLADAFLAVQAVLQTYNSASPYVSLADWDGRSCGDCGCTRSDEDMYHCDACDGSFCESCHSMCDACEHGCCRGCLENGDQDDNLCPDCRGRCVRCKSFASRSALEEHEGLCLSCFEEPDSKVEVEEDPPSIPPPQPPQETIHESLISSVAAAAEAAAPEVLDPPVVIVAA